MLCSHIGLSIACQEFDNLDSLFNSSLCLNVFVDDYPHGRSVFLLHKLVGIIIRYKLKSLLNDFKSFNKASQSWILHYLDHLRKDLNVFDLCLRCVYIWGQMNSQTQQLKDYLDEALSGKPLIFHSENVRLISLSNGLLHRLVVSNTRQALDQALDNIRV